MFLHQNTIDLKIFFYKFLNQNKNSEGFYLNSPMWYMGTFYILKISFFLKGNAVGEAPTMIFVFLKIRTQIRVYGDLNLGGWVVHLLP
jgi:hypothetical protein